jgi:diphosphomevalonate decarboxylase
MERAKMGNGEIRSQSGAVEATVAAGINIALVKYWGKAPGPDNRPAVGSLSLTLDAPGTETTVRFDAALQADTFTLDGVAAPLAPVSRLLDEVRQMAGETRRAAVTSRNTVPTAAGLASSASGFAALGLAAWHAAGLGDPGTPLDRRLVDLVRRGSGSAPRSLLPGFARIDVETAGVEAVVAPPDFEVSLVVALCAAGPKAVMSRDGMAASAATSPYYPAWVESHPADLAAGEAAIRAGDFGALGEIMEHSTMKMHACMLATRPPLRYWTPGTLAALDALVPLRNEGRVFTTMDAGPHVKALCRRGDEALVADALRPVARAVLVARPGAGARVVPPGGAR